MKKAGYLSAQVPKEYEGAGLFQPSDMESQKNSWANTIFAPLEK